jgi:hypothetical protein
MPSSSETAVASVTSPSVRVTLGAIRLGQSGVTVMSPRASLDVHLRNSLTEAGYKTKHPMLFNCLSYRQIYYNRSDNIKK